MTSFAAKSQPDNLLEVNQLVKHFPVEGSDDVLRCRGRDFIRDPPRRNAWTCRRVRLRESRPSGVAFSGFMSRRAGISFSRVRTLLTRLTMRCECCDATCRSFFRTHIRAWIQDRIFCQLLANRWQFITSATRMNVRRASPIF